ncbi:MAG: Trk system potassium transporter TrkA [Lachnospiraceae bacterium]|nr:Trk system potassium transporter TrkA [Lachnospiraceae bacterium]
MFKQKNNKGQGLKIIIVGCGKVGQTLVSQLMKEGHDITLIDKDPQIIQEMTNLYDVMGIVGNGASYSVQMEADIADTDLIIAVTGSDELNLLCCTVAKRVGNCSAIARVRTPDYSKEVRYLREKLGLAMIINPELEAAREAVRILCLPTALEVSTFAHGHAEMIKIKVPDGNRLDGMTIMDLGKTIGKSLADKVLICAVERDKDIYIPSGNFRILKGDLISFVASRTTAKEFLQKIGFKTQSVNNTMIIGGGISAYYLASLLVNMGIAVKIIDSDPERCKELSILLPRAVIINGDGTNEELLKEEGIEYAESFVPLTGIDEENILLTLYAKKVSQAKAITKINRINFKNVVNNLDLGSVIYPKFITSEAIIAYVRAKKDSMNSNIETLYHMFDSRVEAIEFRVESESSLTNIPLMDLNLKKDLLISFINRNGTIIIPSGQDCIKVGDTVMIVTTHTGFNSIQDILS